MCMSGSDCVWIEEEKTNQQSISIEWGVVGRLVGWLVSEKETEMIEKLKWIDLTLNTDISVYTQYNWICLTSNDEYSR